MRPNKKIHQNFFALLYLNSIVPLSKELKVFLAEHVRSVQYQKGDIVYQKGELCTKLHLIKKGLVRGYFISGKKDITTWISTDNEIFTSITGFFIAKPAKESIQCLEDTDCLYLEYKDLEYGLQTFPEISELYRRLLIDYYIHAENRAYMARIPSALERWNYFVETNKPELLNRIPNKYLASLLVMRPETLSRIIKEHTGLIVKGERE
ncbi:Crp/Fnr family transcriptional regulator [Flagellimonas sp. HMM57]|uniref:Crp/Fnr family transcriptional regulator n=1 Tax=unclassified Flagellimonas TaxID=2644544 RepID=UPI0013D73B80|nr:MULTISPECIES: Crp/Fnr family transcriptional regulator [unclassified Flagellimonas]UII75342.1 Crp/Fnr family transcriptional regulator [Flagellimonas sp. HMM57]